MDVFLRLRRHRIETSEDRTDLPSIRRILPPRVAQRRIAKRYVNFRAIRRVMRPIRTLG